MNTDLEKRLKSFVGGQIEIQNKVEEYLYRGEINSISVEDDTLKVKLAWVAKGEGFPPLPKRWVKSDRLDYEASLLLHKEVEIGMERAALMLVTNELVVFYPPNGSKLDISKVEDA